MRNIVFILLLSAIFRAASAQTNVITLTNNTGTVYSNVTIIKIEKDGILFRLSEGLTYDRVKFTNMSKALQSQFGYDPEKARKAEEERLAKLRAEYQAQVARAKAAQYHSIEQHKHLIDPITESDFPKTEKAGAACKEIASDLKAIDRSLELGTSFSKFSDLLTDNVLAIGKIKDLRGEGLPQRFLDSADSCIKNYNESRHWWSEKIKEEFPDVQLLCDYDMREYWSQAGLDLIYCNGIADKKLGANDLAIVQVAEMIKNEQSAVREGILKRSDSYDAEVSGLSVEEITPLLKKALSSTNAP